MINGGVGGPDVSCGGDGGGRDTMGGFGDGCDGGGGGDGATRKSLIAYRLEVCTPRSNRIHGSNVSIGAHAIPDELVHTSNASSGVYDWNPPDAATPTIGTGTAASSISGRVFPVVNGNTGGGGVDGGISSRGVMASAPNSEQRFA